MKLDILFEATTKWKKLGNHKGVFTRIVDPEDEKRKKEEKKAAQQAKRNDVLLDRLEEPFDQHDDIDFDAILKKSPYTSHMDQYDISNFKKTWKNIDGVRVAALSATLFYSVKLSDLYDQDTIDSMYDGQEHVEDSTNVTFYRSPKNPKKIEATV
jgi:hypothetical protein